MTSFIDTDRADLDEIQDRNQSAEVYAAEGWLDSIADNIDYHDYTGGRGAFEPSDYDDEREWLTDELIALFIRAHQESDLGILEFSGALKSVDDKILTAADLGLQSYAKEVGREDDFELEAEPTGGGGL